MALHDVGHALAEEPVDSHDDLVARFHHIADGRLHGGHPRARKGDGELVLGLKEVAEAGHGLVHGQEKIRIQIAQNGADHGLEDPGMNVAGPGPKQHARIVRHLAS